MFVFSLTNVFLYLVLILSIVSYQKHLSFSNNVALIGHINFIAPVINSADDYVFLTSYNGSVSLFDYKTGEPKWIRHHREEETVEKVHTDERHATVLLYRGICHSGRHREDDLDTVPNLYYINVYDILSSNLVNVYQYNEVLLDFFKKEDMLVMAFQERIEIGNVIDNSIEYRFYKDMNIDVQFAYVKIVHFDLSSNRLSLFCIEEKEAAPYFIIVDMSNPAKLLKITKVSELQINKKRKHFIEIYKDHLALIYNRKYLYWIDIENWEEGKYIYHSETINVKDEEELFKEEVVVNGKYVIEANEKAELEMNNVEETFFTQDGHIIIDIFREKFHYLYGQNKLQFIEKLKADEIGGYYFKDGKKYLISIREENQKLLIEKKDTSKKKQTYFATLPKGKNVLQNVELFMGLYTSAEKTNYYFSVFNDSSFTVYKDKEILYSREEALAYIEQTHFYSFQHLQGDKQKRTYPWEFNIVKEIKNFAKMKMSLLNVSRHMNEMLNKKEVRNSLLPFHLMHLTYKENMKLLHISEGKKTNDHIFSSVVKNEETEEVKEKNKKRKVNADDSYNSEKPSFLMNQLFNDVYKRVVSHPSVKHWWNYLVLVSTRGGLIFTFHLPTGLILYKIDLNQFKNTKRPAPKHYLCSYDLTNNNWVEMQGGKKLMFLEKSRNERKKLGINNISGNMKKSDDLNDSEKGKRKKKGIYKKETELSPFRMYSKDSVIVIYKDGNNSNILIFDILNGTILFKKQLLSFPIERFFILPNSGALLAVDHSMNLKIIDVLNKKRIDPINNNALYFFNINTMNSDIRGYTVVCTEEPNKKGKGKIEMGDEISEINKKLRIVETYRINMNEEELEVIAMSKTKKQKIFPVKINADAAIRYKYLNNNIICYIAKTRNKKKDFLYTLYIIDGVGGKYLFSKILDIFAKPPFHILINENFVVVNYYHSYLNKYVVYVLELLLDKEDPGFLNIITSKKEKTVCLFHDENVMIAERQYVIDYNIRSFAFTETKRGITNTHLILLLDTNKIASLVISGDYNRNFYKNINEYITRTNILYNSTGISLNESSLESTTLLFSWGNYLYFTSYQPSGSFDTIENYNVFFLVFIIIVVFVATFFSYTIRKDKTLHAHWT